MSERALRIELADLEDDFKTLLTRQHEHENPKILKQLQERIFNIKTQLRYAKTSHKTTGEEG